MAEPPAVQAEMEQDPLLLHQEDIWLDNIFPLIGHRGDHAVVEPVNKRLQELVEKEDPIFLRKTRIWVSILSYLGPGHYLPLALVCKRFGQLYGIYFATIERPLQVQYGYDGRYGTYGRATKTTTFLSAFCYNLAGLEFLNAVTKELAERRGVERTIAVSHILAKTGDLQLLKRMHQMEFPWEHARTTRTAAEFGQLEVLKYCHLNGCRWDSYTSGWAAAKGHLECLTYAHENQCPFHWQVCWCAAGNGHLHILTWAHQNGADWDPESVGYAAANTGNIDCLKYAVANGCTLARSIDMCSAAALNGYYEVVKYIHENGGDWDEWTCAEAAYNGHFEIVKYVHKEGGPWCEMTTDYAAEGRHLEMLKYTLQNGCPLSEDTCHEAAGDGHLDVVKIIHEQGGHWDEKTCSRAAVGGHLEVVKFAHENKCPWDHWTCSKAALNGYLKVLEYAHTHGCPWTEKTCAEAAYGGRLEALQWLRNQEPPCPWDQETIQKAEERGHHNVANWARDNGCPT